MTESSTESITLGPLANRWAWFPVVLLGLLVSVQLVLFRLSLGDESFAIEPEYYQKAVQWDARNLQRQASERLGWRARAEIVPSGVDWTLRLELLDGSKTALSNVVVSADAFPNARASHVQNLTLHEVSPGTYESPLRVTHLGEWEVRVVGKRGFDIYNTTLRTTPHRATK